MLNSNDSVLILGDTGCGQVLGWLLSVPGASNTLLESVVPYSRMSMIQLLGKVLTYIMLRSVKLFFS